MRKNLLMKAALLVSSALFLNVAEARILRVNNTPGVNVPFTTVAAAVADASSGDTLYIEASTTTYGSITLNSKRLVFIGAGYLLNENTGLQLNNRGTLLTAISIDSLASGSTFIGLDCNNFFISSDVDDITVTRCTSTIGIKGSLITNSKMSNLVVNKSYVAVNMPGWVLENVKVTNCLINPNLIMPGAINGLIRNNVFSAANINVQNSYISNNIFIGSGLTALNSTIKYNLSNGNILPTTAGLNNRNGLSVSAMVVNTGSTDGKFRLAAGSPAIGAGEPIGGVTPDIGMYGTADPYVLSGIPPIPTIYALTVPASVPATATTMSITFSTRSNN